MGVSDPSGIPWHGRLIPRARNTFRSRCQRRLDDGEEARGDTQTLPLGGTTNVAYYRQGSIRAASPVRPSGDTRPRVLKASMPFVPSCFLFLVVRPGAPSSVPAPSSDALVPSSFLLTCQQNQFEKVADPWILHRQPGAAILEQRC